MIARSGVLLAAVACAVALCDCATMPEPKMLKYGFPKNAYVGDVKRPYKVLGPVRSKIDFETLDPNHDEKELCRNYYNRAVRELLKYAKQQGGSAVVDVKSVVFLEDGRRETYATPECSDDGGEGQVLTQGIAVKWVDDGAGAGSWTEDGEKPVEGEKATPEKVAPPEPVVAPVETPPEVMQKPRPPRARPPLKRRPPPPPLEDEVPEATPEERPPQPTFEYRPGDPRQPLRR